MFPQDRDGDFEPQIVPKRKKDISAIEQKIIDYVCKGHDKQDKFLILWKIYMVLR